MYLWAVILVRQSRKRQEVSGKQIKSLHDWLKIWCWWYSGVRTFFFNGCVFGFFFRQRNTAEPRCGIATNTTVSPHNTLREEIIILIKPFPVESSLRMMWYVFVITFFCLIFLTSQSCENMLYDIVCLFHFRNHNFTLNVFCWLEFLLVFICELQLVLHLCFDLKKRGVWEKDRNFRG